MVLEAKKIASVKDFQLGGPLGIIKAAKAVKTQVTVTHHTKARKLAHLCKDLCCGAEVVPERQLRVTLKDLAKKTLKERKVTLETL